MLSRRRLAAGLAITAFAGAALVASPEAMITRVRDTLHSPWFPVILVGLYLARPFLAWPITLLSALVGYRYGFVVGVPLALVGAAGTSLIPYVAGRRLPPDGRVLGRLVGGSRRYFTATGDLRGVIAARFAPTPAEPVSAAAGAARVPATAFVLGTLVGELPWTIAAVALGTSLGAFDPSRISIDWRLAAIGAVAAGVVLAGPAYRAATDRTA